MARAKLEMPDNYSFTTTLAVRISDINYLGHVSNEAILCYIQEARIRFLNYHHFTEQDVQGLGVVMTDSTVTYHAESFHGDTIQIDVCVRDFTKYGCDFYYLISNKKTAEEVALAKTGIVFYDYQARKITQVPMAFKSVIEREAA
ncbi:MAG: acyl-CoA thioesterase [Pseudomonadales bacterium]